MNTTQKPPLGFENSSKLEQSLMETLMSEASQKSNQTTSVATPNVISSLESADGASPCSLLDGPQTDLFGQAPVPASHSAPQAKVSRKKTSATSGPCSSSLSASAAHPSCSVSKSPAQPSSGILGSRKEASDRLSDSIGKRLQERLKSAGSMVYRQTWKQKVTPAGRPYWAHTASALRTNDSGCIGLPTISAREGRDWSRARILASLDNGTGVAKRICSLWLATHSPELIVGLNPCFGAWMMGYPLEWSVATVTAMQSFPKSRRSSSSRASKPSES